MIIQWKLSINWLSINLPEQGQKPLVEIMQNCMQLAKNAEEQKEKSQAIISKWKEKSLPEFPPDQSELSIRERR